MAIITESELEIRLGHVRNSAGRGNGTKNIPDKLREIIGYSAHFEKASDVAQNFGVAPITAHLAKESRAQPEVHDRIQKRLEIVKDQALDKMLAAMGVITDEKIKKLSIKGALSVAKNMAVIVEKTGEKIGTPANNQVVIYAPQLKSESDFTDVKVIERIG